MAEERKLILEGELLVTGRDSVTLEEPLCRARAPLAKLNEAVHVGFKEGEPPCPPCEPGEHDRLEWDIIECRREQFLRIRWRVRCARTIVWKIFELRDREWELR